jgi:hypothetical protein
MYFGITANHQFLYNHQLVFKAKDVPAMGMWKQWTARLVVDHLYHSEIKEIVDSYGITDSQVRIGKWASVLTEKHKSLTDEEKARDKVLASQWRDEGPPLPVKCWCILYVCAAEYPLLISNLSEAEEKAGKYVAAVLKQLERQLSMHAMVFVAYQDTAGAVKVSEYVA